MLLGVWGSLAGSRHTSGAVGAYLPPTRFDCTLFIEDEYVPSFGSGATCGFPNTVSLRIYLGEDFTLRAGDVVEIKDGVLRNFYETSDPNQDEQFSVPTWENAPDPTGTMYFNVDGDSYISCENPAALLNNVSNYKMRFNLWMEDLLLFI